MKKYEKGNVILIDANSFVYKSYFGGLSKKESKFTPIKMGNNRILTGLMQAIYDVMRNVGSLEYLFLVFDAPDGSFYRRSLFPEYKKNRAPTPDELVVLKNEAKDIIKNKLGIPVIEYPSYEADDAIGSLAKRFSLTHNVIIVSPDKDMCQLITEDILILRPYKKDNNKGFEYISPVGVNKYYGVNPYQIPDYLSLLGDTVDNLPGIDNIGKTRASNLLNRYNTIEDIYSVIEQIKVQDKENEKYLLEIEKNYDFLKLVKLLATIKTDLEHIETHINESLKLATEVQSAPTFYARVEIIAQDNYWAEHLYNFLK